VDVKETLDRFTPETARMPDWDRVLRDTRPSRARWAAPRLAIVGAVVGLAALLAVAPWRGAERTGILDRARAAVGGGPVLHAVVREGWGADVIDLEMGESRWINGEREVWYDPARGLHSVSWFDGSRQGEQLWPAGEVPRLEARTFGFLAEGYRQALEAGRARLVGPGVVDGTPVYWIRVDTQVAPEGSRPREWVQDVAVSRESYEPVATRGTRDGGTGPGDGLLIVEHEMLAPGEGDFTKGLPSWVGGAELREVGEQIELSEAASALGREPLWLGPEHEGLRLAKVGRRTTTIGRTRETQLHGEAAAQRKACVAEESRKYLRGKLRRPYCIERYGRFGIREGRVFAVSPIWGATYNAIQLVYSNDAVSRGPVRLRPNYKGPFVIVHQSTDPRGNGFFGATAGHAPPEGSVFFFGGFALLKHDGAFVAIQASSEKLTLSAARALKPLSGGSGVDG
jgi:hypothetical protein